MIIIHYLVLLSLFAMFVAAYVLVGIIVALLTYWLAYLVNRDGLSARQFWFVVYLPVLMPIVLGYEIIARFRTTRPARSLLDL